MKTKISNRIIKWFFGISGVVDERVRTEIGKVATKTLITFFGFEILFNFGAFILPAMGKINDFENYFYKIMMIQFVVILIIFGGFSIFVLRSRGITDNDVDSKDKSQVINRLKHKWLKLAPVEFLIYWLATTVLNLEGHNFIISLVNFRNILGALIFTLLFNTTMYFYEKGEIHIIKNDD